MKKLLLPLLLVITGLGFGQFPTQYNTFVVCNITSTNAKALYKHIKSFDTDKNGSINSNENSNASGLMSGNLVQNIVNYNISIDSSIITFSSNIITPNEVNYVDFYIKFNNNFNAINFSSSPQGGCTTFGGSIIQCNKTFNTTDPLTWLTPTTTGLDEATSQGLTIKNTPNTLALEFTTPSSVMMYDINGNMVTQTTEKNNAFTLENITSGLYILNITNQNGYVYKTKTWVP